MHGNAPAPVDLLVTHGVVITVDAERRIYRDGAIAIDDGRIAEVGRSAELAARFDARRTIDARGGAVTPGFVDAHTHVSQHLGRGSIPDAWAEHREHEQWLPYWTHMTPEDDDASTTLACLEMVRNGTTAFSDLGGHFEVERKAAIVERIGLRGVLTEIAWDLPPHEAVGTGDTDQTLRRLERVVDALPFHGPGAHAWGGVGIPGMGTASDDLLVGAKALADRHGLVCFTHASFGDADTEAYRRHAGGVTATEHFQRLGILDDRLQLIHMIRTAAHEVPLLAAAGTHVVHCPAASLRVGMGVSRVGVFPEMVEAGVNVALGSDSGNYSDFYDVGRQMYLAATVHREARGVMPTITAEQAIEMATLNGARAIGAGDRLGSLEPGKQADLVIHRWDRPEWRPGIHPVNSLVYSAQSSGVDTVIVGGEVILEGGRFTRVDEEAELARVDAAARALNARSGYRVEGRWPILEAARTTVGRRGAAGAAAYDADPGGVENHLPGEGRIGMARAQDIAGILGTWSRGHRPLYQQLADALRAAIERRDLPPGARVPAERELARTLVVSRNTVASAYEELKDQGYLESRQGSGTRVIGGNVGGVDPAVASSVPRLASLWRRGSEPEVVNLTRSGFRGVGDLPPDTIRLDPSELARLIDDSVGYSREGLPELRIEIARWMTRNQLPTDADQVLVTTGAQQAINLLTTVYLRPGDGVILENPTYYGAIDSFRWADARLLPVAIGAHGPNVDEVAHLIERQAPCLGYFTLSFHNPTGAVASDAVRRRLAAIAEASALPTIDDLELASHYVDHPPPPPLAAYTDAPNVISIASMSKMFWAGLRIGWVRADPEVLALVARAKVVADLGSSLPTQLIAARMLREGDAIASVRRAHLVVRRRVLEEAIAELLPDWTFDPPAGGVFLWLRLPMGDGVELSQLAERYGVLVQPGSTLSADGTFNDYVRLPFVEQPDTIRIGVARLARAWAAYRRGAALARSRLRHDDAAPVGVRRVAQAVVGAVIRG